MLRQLKIIGVGFILCQYDEGKRAHLLRRRGYALLIFLQHLRIQMDIVQFMADAGKFQYRFASAADCICAVPVVGHAAARCGNQAL